MNLGRLGKVKITRPTALEIVALSLVLAFFLILVAVWK